MNVIRIYEQEEQRLLYYPDFFSKSYYSELAETLPWRQNHIRLFGKTHLEPRLTAWFGPAYSYSHIHWPEQAPSQLMGEIAQPLRELTAFPFNAVLANYYRNGQDSMGWHSDDEPEMDTDLIASVTFGGARAFKFRSKQSGQVISINLLDRSLLLMHHMQKDWQHALPKTSRNNQPRINLTFRRIV